MPDMTPQQVIDEISNLMTNDPASIGCAPVTPDEEPKAVQSVEMGANGIVIRYA